MWTADRVDELYQNPEEWAYKAMLNIANMGYFLLTGRSRVREIYLAYRPGKAVSQNTTGPFGPVVLWRTFYSEKCREDSGYCGNILLTNSPAVR